MAVRRKELKDTDEERRKKKGWVRGDVSLEKGRSWSKVMKGK